MSAKYPTWVKVTRSSPCPICGKPDWCGVTVDGQIARCMRIESLKPEAGGWLHILSDPKPRTPAPRDMKPVETMDFTELRDKYVMSVTNPKLYTLASKLGIPAEALTQMEAGWNGKDYVFPMYDGNCECIGLRVRTMEGKKFAVTGSSNGLFIPTIGVYPDSDSILYVVEGPTDTATLVAMSAAGIGLPQTGGGVEYLIQFIEGRRRDVVIIADHDEAKERPDGTLWYPGVDGAYRVAEAIRGHTRNLKVIQPPKNKDVREWYKAGGTRESIDMIAGNTAWST